MNIVRYRCGCIGSPPDDKGNAAILVACDSDDGGPGRIDRPMKDKAFESIDYTASVYRAFVDAHKYMHLRQAIRDVVAVASE